MKTSKSSSKVDQKHLFWKPTRSIILFRSNEFNKDRKVRFLVFMFFLASVCKCFKLRQLPGVPAWTILRGCRSFARSVHDWLSCFSPVFMFFWANVCKACFNSAGQLLGVPAHRVWHRFARHTVFWVDFLSGSCPAL